MERRRLASFLKRGQRSQHNEQLCCSSNTSEAQERGGVFRLIAPGRSSRAALQNVLIALVLVCLISLALYCTSDTRLGDLQWNALSEATAREVGSGKSKKGSRLKLTLSGLSEATESGVISQAALAVAERNELKSEDKAVEKERVETNDKQNAAQASKQASVTDMSNIFDKIAEDIQTWAVRGQASPTTDEQATSNFSSPASLQKQQKKALDTLFGSGLVKDKSSRGALLNEPQFSHLETDRSKCPLRYDRMDYDDIRRGRYQPYLLGERAKPDCNNCDRDNLWSHFCQFQTHGPICPGWLKWQLASDWVKRAEEGSPGVKELLRLTPCDLFSYIRDRTLWLIGDSLTLEWDKAVQCFLYEFWDMEMEYLKLENPPPKFQGWCSHMAQGAKVCFIRANTGEELTQDILPSLAELGALKSDVMVINFAIWSNRKADYRRNITVFAEYYNAHKAELPITIWRDAPVQHFDTRSGDYVWPVPTDICKAVPQIELLQDNSLKALHPSAQIVAEGGWRNKIALPVMRGLRIPIMNTWNQSLPLWQYHTHFSEKNGDCTHMCHPSEYQYWVFELYQTLKTIFPEVRISA